jgi:hypothetical protein
MPPENNQGKAKQKILVSENSEMGLTSLGGQFNLSIFFFYFFFYCSN